MRLLHTRSLVTAALVATVLSTSAGNGRPALAPTGFIPNKGQFVDRYGKPDPRVAFLFHGDGLHVQLRQGGFSYDTWHVLGPVATDAPEAATSARDFRIHRIDIQLEGSDPAARWEAFQPSTDVLNYYTTGTGEAGITDVHHYQRVLCRNIYPFIDLEFRTSDDERGVKYDFIVHRGGDPAMIRLRYFGARTALDASAKAVTLTWDD
ncbi:MAG TPA: hypothetical protein VHL57_12780, partial [Flavobacteriales bacterium]|nr:hypothetical protein [Flavobacteriales bacterium]